MGPTSHPIGLKPPKESKRLRLVYLTPAKLSSHEALPLACSSQGAQTYMQVQPFQQDQSLMTSRSVHAQSHSLEMEKQQWSVIELRTS